MTERQGVSFSSALKWAFLLQWGQQFIAAAISFVIAAFIGPRDFGVVTLAITYVSFIYLFIEQGAQATIIQQQSITQRQLSTIFWINITLGTFGCILILFLAPILSSLHSLAELSTAITYATPIILCQSACIVQVALCQKRKEFKKLTIRSTTAAIFGGVLGLGLAAAGWGWMSVVLQQVITHALSALLLWKVSDWRPSLNVSFRETVPVLKFSAGVVAGKLALVFANKSDIVVIGFFYGPVAVGLYRFAQRIVELVFDTLTRPITMVALPYFSECQFDTNQLKDRYLKCLNLSSALTIPVLGIVAGLSDILLETLFPKWTEAAFAVLVMCLTYSLKVFIIFSNCLLLANGKLFLRATMLWLVGLLNPLALAWIASRTFEAQNDIQVNSIALTLFFTMALLYLPVNIGMAKRVVEVSLFSFLRSVSGAYIGGFIAGSLSRWTVILLVPWISGFVVLIISLFVGLSSAAIVFWIADRNVITTLRQLRAR